MGASVDDSMRYLHARETVYIQASTCNDCARRERFNTPSELCELHNAALIAVIEEFSPRKDPKDAN
jgi:hypothetical protein